MQKIGERKTKLSMYFSLILSDIMEKTYLNIKKSI